ncbi:hypothetical protein NA57DRAFT_19542, partial [Rhizodiscina lignyota]
PSKHRVLEKPDRYRPPSHPARLPRKRQTYGGPALSDEEIQKQKAKQYPHMMPPEGSFMRWFLTNRPIHLFISFGILTSLAGFMFIENFRRSLSSEHYEMLPSRSLLPLHPFQYFGRLWEIWKLHTLRISAETEEKRQRNLEDAQKRAEYRRAHGIEVGGIAGVFGMGVDTPPKTPHSLEDASTVQAVPDGTAIQGREAPEGAYADFDGKKRRVKRWFGIW